MRKAVYIHKIYFEFKAEVFQHGFGNVKCNEKLKSRLVNEAKDN